MKRIFIALKVVPGETLLRMISILKSGLNNEKIKWTSIDNIHITLAFLGDTEEKRIKTISEMLKEKCEVFGNFDLTIKGAGVFKNLNDPRIIWAGIEPSEKLILLNEIIINGLKGAGTDIEYHSFNPHLTIGRVRDIKDKMLLKTYLDKFQNRVIQTVPVNEVILYESILLHSGPVYKQIFIVRLA